MNKCLGGRVTRRGALLAVQRGNVLVRGPGHCFSGCSVKKSTCFFPCLPSLVIILVPGWDHGASPRFVGPVGLPLQGRLSPRSLLHGLVVPRGGWPRARSVGTLVHGCMAGAVLTRGPSRHPSCSPAPHARPVRHRHGWQCGRRLCTSQVGLNPMVTRLDAVASSCLYSNKVVSCSYVHTSHVSKRRNPFHLQLLADGALVPFLTRPDVLCNRN